ncbi:acyl-CoA N-acyltransferase [Phakopsora pachyrhizi]|uniref:Acyl-CoA N-acyltransferase n=1 Tax=Phakopsora pachyrhizi TaxID=170000 RepID=A0AAV0APK0_PHAPC|nr:acyl-CoA N-acyltransferase [Phakopsora pachyrhizi]
MSLLRPFQATDLFRFNNVNLDPWTETYSVSYYLQYLCTWPDLINLAEAPNGQVMGYGKYNIELEKKRFNFDQAINSTQKVMGKTEGEGKNWHGHVSAITVSPLYRRLSLARSMMGLLEQASDQQRCYFVDLFVRVSNDLAIEMYEKFGYSVYQRVLNYYSGYKADYYEEDAFDMRKALSIDKDKSSIRKNGREIIVDHP